jgi:tetratricopeptide (TPR) repeat protein
LCLLTVPLCAVSAAQAQTLENALPAAPANAEPTSAEAQAIKLAYEGKARFERSDFRGALTLFREAQRLASSPVFDLYIARAHKALGAWVQALEAYESAEHTATDVENHAWLVAQESAHAEGLELLEEIPRLSITAPRLHGTSAPTLKLDGRDCPWPLAELRLNPGRHVLAATWGEEAFADELTASPGEHIQVALPFPTEVPASTAHRDAAVPAAPPQARADHGQVALAPWMWTAFGFGTGAAILGAVTGSLTLSYGGELAAWCAAQASRCPNGEPTDQPQADKLANAHYLASVTDVSLAVAGLSALTGLTLLVLDHRQPKKASVVATGNGLEMHGAF